MSTFTRRQQQIVDEIVANPGQVAAAIGAALDMTENHVKVQIHNIRKAAPAGMRILSGRRHEPGVHGSRSDGYVIEWAD